MRPRQMSRPTIRVEDGGAEPRILTSGGIQPPGGRLIVETDQIEASIATQGYVSGVAANSFLDKASGARDLGFGLSIVDFLLEPAAPDQPVPENQYPFNDLYHGKIAKRYVEGPQICTQARSLPATVIQGDGFVAVKLRYRWNIPYPPRERAGSVWEQTLVFPAGERYFLSSDRVTSVSESPELFFRVDMPGHIKHNQGREFRQIYLSTEETPFIPSSEFRQDFPPDARFLYRRGDGPVPRRIIRAYQVSRSDEKPGPWLAGMTLNAEDVYQAWCHQRGYVCMIQELGGRPIRAGDTFGACYLIGWFDDVAAMEMAYDRHQGYSGLELIGPPDNPTGYRGLSGRDLPPVMPG